MRWALFYHSLVSDWNHGNAHFLRGITGELLARGETVHVYEPADGWSRRKLLEQHGPGALEAFHECYPQLESSLYTLDTLELERELDGVDVILAHEWNEPELIRRLGRHRARHRNIRLLFHDTHHRAITAPQQLRQFDLRSFDAVLAYGQVIADEYRRRGWHSTSWTWHEAADTRVFWPRPRDQRAGDLTWIGNWGDEERTDELQEFLLEPIQSLRLAACLYGVRYPDEGQRAVAEAGAEYCGWLPNHCVPPTFCQFDVTVHIPRRPYRERIPGVPTIRVFEALACGIPLVSVEWDDAEGLFRPGADYLVVRTGAEMRQALQQVLAEPSLASGLVKSGLETIRNHHTCAHRVDQLFSILRELGTDAMGTNKSSETPVASHRSMSVLAAPIEPTVSQVKR